MISQCINNRQIPPLHRPSSSFMIIVSLMISSWCAEVSQLINDREFHNVVHIYFIRHASCISKHGSQNTRLWLAFVVCNPFLWRAHLISLTKTAGPPTLLMWTSSSNNIRAPGRLQLVMFYVSVSIVFTIVYVCSFTSFTVLFILHWWVSIYLRKTISTFEKVVDMFSKQFCFYLWLSHDMLRHVQYFILLYIYIYEVRLIAWSP